MTTKTNPKPLTTEAAAWRLIARQIHIAMRAPEAMRMAGLCGYVEKLWHKKRITCDIHRTMRLRISAAMVNRLWAYAPWPEDVQAREEAPYRILAALWFALDAEADAKTEAR